MSHHGREYEDDGPREVWPVWAASALALIKDIAQDNIIDTCCTCDSWLEKYGFECEASRRRQREHRADELDAEIARLRAERAKL